MNIALIVDELVNLAAESAGRQRRGRENEYENFAIHGLPSVFRPRSE
jgi:hypothetical protein